MSLTYGSLFAGIGGFDLGFDRAGRSCRWQVEIDKFCNRVLEARWPGVRRYGDIREIGPRELEPVDVVCGGFPCQDLSVAGRRAGLGGERSGLWWEFHRVISVLRPCWVVVENVPGLLSSNKGRDMGAILRALGDLGYGYAYRVLDAAGFGLAQRRKRVFIVGCFGDGAAAAKVLLEPEGGAGNPPPRREAGTEVAHCLGASTGGVSGKEQQVTLVPVLEEGAVAATLSGVAGVRGWSVNAEAAAGNHVIPVVRTLTASDGPKYDGDTETFVTQDAILHGMAVRRLTPREAEILQGFPPGWTCLCDARGDTLTCRCPDSPRYRALGNAVAVPVAEWVAQRIREVAGQ